MLIAYSDGTVSLHMQRLTVIEDANKPEKRVSVFQHTKTSTCVLWNDRKCPLERSTTSGLFDAVEMSILTHMD